MGINYGSICSILQHGIMDNICTQKKYLERCQKIFISALQFGLN